LGIGREGLGLELVVVSSSGPWAVVGMANPTL
jgi:hypothetical protein